MAENQLTLAVQQFAKMGDLAHLPTPQSQIEFAEILGNLNNRRVALAWALEQAILDNLSDFPDDKQEQLDEIAALLEQADDDFSGTQWETWFTSLRQLVDEI